ncbi:MAG: OmpA family protein [Alphaproteobacteria bacterium]|nr:OmpA family protein [Alphaproteobacteria bacterium]
MLTTLHILGALAVLGPEAAAETPDAGPTFAEAVALDRGPTSTDDHDRQADIVDHELAITLWKQRVEAARDALGQAVLTHAGADSIEMRRSVLAMHEAHLALEQALLKAARHEGRLHAAELSGAGDFAELRAKADALHTDAELAWDDFETARAHALDAAGLAEDSTFAASEPGVELYYPHLHAHVQGRYPADQVEIFGVRRVSVDPAENLQRVYFAFDSAAPDTAALNALAWDAATLREHRDAVVRVEGHADAVGTPAYNRDLSRRRAEAVRRYLLANDVWPEQIQLTALGETDPAIPTADRSLANRRVELRVMKGDGLVDGTIDDPVDPDILRASQDQDAR